MASSAVSTDYYSVLGVAPDAQEVVIRAAYRALMRHYHPDANADPQAEQRAQEITAAFAVLRDPERRAEYDAQRAGAWWIGDEPPAPTRRPPAMRGVALASAAVALALVVALWARGLPEPPRPTGNVPTPATRQAPAPKPQPVVELEPESERLSKLGVDAPIVAPPPPPLTQVDPVTEASLAPHPVPAAPRVAPARMAASAPPRRIEAVTHGVAAAPVETGTSVTPPKARPVAAEVSAGCKPGETVVVSVGCKNERVAMLDRMAAGYFSQSMARADASKKQLLLTSHTRSATTRGACRSDSCLSAAYLRQIREITAIMEDRPLPPQ